MKKEYLVQLENGETLGPMDEETLKRMAENDEFPENAPVRSSMIAVWSPAKSVDCLKKIYRAKMLAKAEQFASDPKAQLRAKMEIRGDYDPLSAAISQEGITYQNCGFLTRFLAGLFDLVILAAVALVLLFACWSLQVSGILSSGVALDLFCILTWGCAATYYMYFLSEWGQTPGQRFWGLVVITDGYTKVYPIKGFLFFLLVFFFGILSPLTWLILAGKSTLQERLPGVRVKRIFIAR